MDSQSGSTAVILVDHGSKVAASNELLLEIAEAFGEQSGWSVVEPAHMELAEPSIATAFDRCVQRGATQVIVMPYFLGPGRHSSEDIPRLARDAAYRHPGVAHLVSAPLGLHDLILKVIDERISEALESPGNC